MAGSPPPGPQGYPPQGGYQQPQQPYPPQQSGYPPQGGQPGFNPAAPYGVHPRSGIPYSDKQKMVAGLLQIFIGGLGIGRFYTGHTGLAVAQLCVTIFTCGIGGIWPFIDGIMILTSDDATDVDGRPLRPN
jgi:TM2 domain-containing membrane protein YozV